MSNEFREYDLDERLSTKFGEYAPCGSFKSIAEIDRISDVDCQEEGIDNNKKPLTKLIPPRFLLYMAWKQHKKNIECIGIENSRGIEYHAPP